MTSTSENKANKDNTEESDLSATESLAERSARLEAEAAMGNFGTLNEDGTGPESHSPEQATEAYADADPAVIKKLQDELNSSRDQTLRALAEAENARKRARQDREDASRYAISNFARDLLNVADNLRRGLNAVPDELRGDERLSGLVEGIEATERELLRIFERNGVLAIDPLGKPFDPNFHEVMFEAPGTGQPAGTVVELVETGYILNSRLLRPARVGVAKDDGTYTQGSSGDDGGFEVEV